jgi:hypothetical protein
MHRPSGNAAVRLTLGTLVFAAFAMALVQPVQAQAAVGSLYFTNTLLGTADQTTGGCGIAPIYGLDAVPPTPDATGKAYLARGLFGVTCTTTFTFTATAPMALSGPATVHVFIACDAPALIRPGPAGALASARTILLKGDEVINQGDTSFDTPTLCFTTPVEMTMTVDTAGTEFAAGDVLNAQFLVWMLSTEEDVLANAYMLTGGVAPSSIAAAGLPSGSAPTNPDDVDGDGLNDTCEMKYFGNTTAQNGTGDPDGDGLSNAAECLGGTDPTKADTDGDGVNDKDDPYPNDPTRGGSGNTTTTTSSSSSTSRSTSSSSTTTSGSRSSSSSGDAGADDSRGTCADDDTSDAVDCLESDLGYVGMSAGGFLAVVVLCIVALATRWSL